MKRTLTLKLVLMYLSLAVAAFILVSTAGSSGIQNELIKKTSTDIYREANQIASDQAGYFYDSEESANRVYRNLSAVANYQDARIWLLDTEGNILLNTDRNISDPPEHLEAFDPVVLGSSYYATGNFFGYFDEDVISVLSPVVSNMTTRGYVAIHVAMSSIVKEREALIVRMHLLVIALFLLFLAAMLIMSMMVNRPISKITAGAREYAAGNYTHRIQIKTGDELEYLAETLNYMSEEIGKTEESQRKFIANVSHDFRSPLTSIKGYVEAIRDGVIPPEQMEHYLDIVLFETDRLNKLTEGLLTLNHGGQNAFYLNPQEFDINQVIKDTCATFEGICTEKRITAELILTGDTMPVRADKVKIQQVLYNLIDNAIKFSHPNSSLEIETTLRHDKVYISVRDHGIGISRDQLPKIWDRFYKTDASRGKDKKGLGLGLSIVKDIITAHNQNISVVSTEGAGTEFTFTLDHAG